MNLILYLNQLIQKNHQHRYILLNRIIVIQHLNRIIVILRKVIIQHLAVRLLQGQVLHQQKNRVVVNNNFNDLKL